MAKNFNELRQRMSPEAQAASRLLAKNLKAEMPLYELRQAHGLSQTTIADILEVRQPTIAKMERNVDMYISTLRKYIEAMGGALNITAAFPEGTVQIGNFTEINPKRLGAEIKIKASGKSRRVPKTGGAVAIQKAGRTSRKLVATR